MRRMLACAILLAAAGCAILGPAVRERPGTILAADGTELTEAELASALAPANIVILGEVHDNPVHHARQARLVRQLQPQGIAFEMIPAASEEGIHVFLAQGGAPDQIGPAIGWERMGWPDWRIYAPIFNAAAGAYIAGGGVARGVLRAAGEIGAAAAYGPGAWKIGLGQPLDAAVQAEFEDEMIAAHCNRLSRQVAARLVEAQRLRDARFAYAALWALAMGGGDRAVLITGDGHARTDRGVPAYLRVAAPELKVLSVGMLELPPGADPVAAAQGQPYDFVWFSRPVDRGDPCAQFG
jgi:uncharacterized iron-regulated protein